MRANSPSALFASLSLHVLFAAALFLISILVSRQQPAPPVIFELVAGAPTAPDEREAPALGNSNVSLNVPKAPLTRPKQPEPESVREEVIRPPEPKQSQPKAKTPPKTTPKNEPKQMSYEEFTKKHGKPQVAKNTPGPRTAKVPRIDTKGITGGVVGGSTANTRGGGGGKALTRAEADAMTVYVEALKNRLQIAHNELKPSGVGDTLSAEVEFFVAANGEIGNVRIVRSSGNREFDDSVLASFRRITWPGARPDNRSDTWRLTFRMREEE